MRISKRGIAAVVLTSVLALGLGACSGTTAGGASSGAGGSGGSGGTSGGGAASVPTATFSGSSSGKAVMNLCTDNGGYSVFVTVDGDSDKLPGVIGKDNMDFTGKDSIYTIDKSGALPQISADGNTVKLDGVKLKSIIDPTKEITFAGSVVCP